MPRYLALMLINTLVLAAVLIAFGVRINISASFPLGLYRALDDPWRKQDLVMACLPKSVGQLGIERGYLGLSSECEGHTPVIKRVVAIAGDKVVIDKAISVNGQAIANTPVATTDAAGRQLKAATSRITSKKHVWLVSNHTPTSFDSRYYGEIPASMVKYKVVPLWTF
ncbi:MAG: conjugative transfer signal peptidase TraF [Granulosicoccus sp.]